MNCEEILTVIGAGWRGASYNVGYLDGVGEEACVGGDDLEWQSSIGGFGSNEVKGEGS